MGFFVLVVLMTKFSGKLLGRTHHIPSVSSSRGLLQRNGPLRPRTRRTGAHAARSQCQVPTVDEALPLFHSILTGLSFPPRPPPQQPHPICSISSRAWVIMLAPVKQTMPAISMEYQRALGGQSQL